MKEIDVEFYRALQDDPDLTRQEFMIKLLRRSMAADPEPPGDDTNILISDNVGVRAQLLIDDPFIFDAWLSGSSNPA